MSHEDVFGVDDVAAAPTWPVANVVVDCPEPRVLADFYHRLLGWEYAPGHEEKDPDGDHWLALKGPAGMGLAFQRDPRYQAPTWPDSGQGQMMHLDIPVTDLDVAHERALAAGARALTGPPEPSDDMFRVYADPAGHPFCLCLQAEAASTGTSTLS